MSSLRLSTSGNSSNASSSQFERTVTEDHHVTKVNNFAKDLLRSRIFLGRYIERRLISQQIGYRDIVVLSAAEVELKKDLLEVQYKLKSIYPAVYIGIVETDEIGCSPPGAVCLTTEIDNQPFGPFWFQIKTLKFREDEVIANLKCLRHISESFLELEPILTGGSKTKVVKAITSNLEESVSPIESLNETFTEIKQNLKSAVSITNVKEFFTFIFAFIIAIFTGSTAFVNFLGNFILALVRETSILIKNSTPMFLGFLDFLSKIVGGFYILLAMMFKQNAPPPTTSRSLNYRPRQDTSYYDDKHFD